SMVKKLQGYLGDAAATGWAGEAAERRFSAIVGRAKISGSIDRLEHHPERGLRVIDYKTGSSKPKDEEVAAHPQLAAYQAALEADAFGPGRPSAGAALVQLGQAAPAPARTAPLASRPSRPSSPTRTPRVTASPGRATNRSSAPAGGRS
ncbi:RecB family exonuclease, partial [Corynebacterium striatum]|uniref:RecB family exonuclease n=1 Tax=Corynebacterium striatum TaxID=43770 RepID=UPI003F7CE7B2